MAPSGACFRRDLFITVDVSSPDGADRRLPYSIRQRRSECLVADELTDARRRRVRALSRSRTGESASARTLRRRRFRLQDTDDRTLRGAPALAKARTSRAVIAFGRI